MCADIISPWPGPSCACPPRCARPSRSTSTACARSLGEDYRVEDGALVFERELRKDRISGWRWFLGAWGVGHLPPGRQVDVRYERADGTPAVAEKLDIELRP